MDAAGVTPVWELVIAEAEKSSGPKPQVATRQKIEMRRALLLRSRNTINSQLTRQKASTAIANTAPKGDELVR
jgi:hypothetical protein